jgi:hypothetical protein
LRVDIQPSIRFGSRERESVRYSGGELIRWWWREERWGEKRDVGRRDETGLQEEVQWLSGTHSLPTQKREKVREREGERGLSLWS